jgi:hypothetical protein
MYVRSLERASISPVSGLAAKLTVGLEESWYMRSTLSDIKGATAALLAGFDAAAVPTAALNQVLRDAGAVEKMMATLAAMAAAALADRGPKTSNRQAVRDLARASGTSLGEASRAMSAAKQALSQPEVGAAARAGELSRQQLGLVAGAANDNPAAAERLLALARTGSMQELVGEAGRARSIGKDFEERRKAIRAARSLREWTDEAGVWNLRARGLPEDGARIMSAVSKFADKAFEDARKQGKREAPEAYAYDGLLGLATAGGAQSPGTCVLVRVDHSTLLRGYAVDGETCEVSGFGPISAQAIYDIMDTGDPFLKAVVTKGKDVVGVSHLGRRPNAHQQTALDWMFPTCAAEGCGTRADFLETDHRVNWALTHYTVLDLLDRLCKFHHSLKTLQGWRLVDGRGKRPFVGPDDPRNPRHNQARASGQAPGPDDSGGIAPDGGASQGGGPTHSPDAQIDRPDPEHAGDVLPGRATTDPDGPLDSQRRPSPPPERRPPPLERDNTRFRGRSPVGQLWLTEPADRPRRSASAAEGEGTMGVHPASGHGTRSRDQSVVRLRNKYAASGAETAIRASDQTTAASRGWFTGQPW